MQIYTFKKWFWIYGWKSHGDDARPVCGGRDRGPRGIRERGYRKYDTKNKERMDGKPMVAGNY